MNGMKLIKASLLMAAVVLALPGCSHKGKVSKDQVQFLSHMDQARFFQRQGELKASNQEAESASKLAPKNIAPYLLIVDNLLITGDANTSEDELRQIQSHLGKGQPPQVTNTLAKDWARAELLKRDYAAALKHLDAYRPESKDGAKSKSEFDELRGRILLTQGELHAAKKAFQDALKENSGSVAAKVGLSKVAYQEKDLKRAKALSEDALKMDKENSEAWLWKAQMAQHQKDYGAAEDAYMKALDGIGQYDVMTYKKYRTMSSLIDVLRAEGKIQEAYVYEEILAKSGPGQLRSDFEAAIKAYRGGDLDQAASDLGAILKLAPNNLRASMMLGLVRFQQGRVEDSQKILKSAEANGHSLQASKLLAATQIRMGQSQQAQEMLQKLKGADNDPGVLALVGVAAMSSGEPNVGRKYIEKSLALKPDNLKLRLRYANWLMAQNDFEKAVHQAKLAIKSNPDSAAARRLEVEAYVKSNQSAEAFQAVAAWRHRQPNNVAAIITEGDLEVSQHHFNKALAVYKQAEKIDPKTPSTQVALGRLMLAQNRPDEAIPHFERAVALDPNNLGALRALMGLSTGNKKQLSQTSTFLKKLTKQNPKAAGPQIVLLETALRQGNIKESKSLTEKIKTLGGKKQQGFENLMSAVYTNAAMAAIHNNNPDQAKKVVGLALKQFPRNLQIGLVNAHLLFVSSNESGALKVLRDLKRDNPNSAKPYLEEAGYRTNKKQFDQAINLYKLALQKSENADIFMRLASVQIEAGQKDHAVKTLEKAARIYPDAPEVLLQLGLAYQSTNALEKAETTYQKLLKLSPDQPVALNNLAWIYQKNNDKRAGSMAQRAYQLKPNSAAIADTYGWIIYNEGKVKDSIPVLKKAHKLAPNQKEISLHLAEAYKADGRMDKAKELLKSF